jgi:AcrR family transcriptional regulator
MGRPSMSEETIANNKVCIIRAAMKMIRDSGIQSVSARSLGAIVGMNSALLYRYFKDIDEVILFACVHVLQEYTVDMSQATAHSSQMSDSEIYILSWQIFCRHAFMNPSEYSMLFFSRHSRNLPEVIKEYFQLFPYENRNVDDYVLQGMFRTANLRNRNLLLLIPILEGNRSDAEIILINDLTVSYFYSLLVQLTDEEPNCTPESQEERMMKACKYLIEI